MDSVVKILEKLNEAGSPIEIMDNESFSVPFISEKDGRMYLTLFSFTSCFSFSDMSEKTTIEKVFYINPNNIFEYDVKDAQEVQLIAERAKLFSRNRNGFEGISSAEKYNRLVELTDEIIANSGNLKKNVSEYADIFSSYVSDELVPYYFSLGHDYFLWLNSLI